MYIVLPFALIAAVASAVLAIIKSLLKEQEKRVGTRKFPGPKGLPWIGRVHDVPIRFGWFKFKEWADMYGPIYQTTMMGRTHLWISSEKIATELISKRGNIYSDRPAVPNVHGTKTRGEYLPLLGFGDAWKRQRKYGHHIHTKGRGDSYYGYPQLETKYVLRRLLENHTKYAYYIDQYAARLVSRLAWGTPEPAGDLKKNAFALLHGISPAGPPSNVFPALMWLPDFLAPWKKEERVRHAWEEGFYKGNFNDVKAAVAEKRAGPSWSKHYLDNSKFFGFDEHEAAYAVGMMALAGVQTIGAPIDTFFLAMVLYPEWQAALREEVDRVGGGELPTMDQSPQMPILRAILKECFRWRPPVPTGIPHESMEDDIWEGHFIPKGTYVHAVEWSMSRDSTVYPEPDAFKPDRWLDARYPTYKEPLTKYPTLVGHHQFGFGRRVCQGQEFAITAMMTLCSAVVSAFSLERAYGADGKVVPIPAYNFSTLLISRPLQFAFECKPRSSEKRDQIVQQWDEAKKADDALQGGRMPSWNKPFEGLAVYL